MTAYILLGHGFEEIEAVAPCDILRRGGVETKYVGVGGSEICGGRGIKIIADIEIKDVNPVGGDIAIVPGGMGGVESLEASEAVSDLLRSSAAAGISLAAICAGPRVLARLGLLDGKTITCYPGMGGQMSGAAQVTDRNTEQDGDLVTGQAAGSAIDFGLAVLKYLKGADEAEKVRRSIYYG